MRTILYVIDGICDELSKVTKHLLVNLHGNISFCRYEGGVGCCWRGSTGGPHSWSGWGKYGHDSLLARDHACVQKPRKVLSSVKALLQRNKGHMDRRRGEGLYMCGGVWGEAEKADLKWETERPSMKVKKVEEKLFFGSR